MHPPDSTIELIGLTAPEDLIRQILRDNPIVTMVGSSSQVLNISGNNYENGQESGSEGDDLSDSASTFDEDMELWVRNIRAEVETNPSSVDGDTVMRYWSDLCVDPVGNQHGDRIEDRTTISSDALDTKITIEELFLRAVPLEHYSRPFLLFNLSDSLGRRFSYDESIEGLDRAVRLAEEGVALLKESPPVETPEESIDFTAIGLLNLGILLLARYEHMKDISNLEAAISHTQEALSLLDDANSHYSTRLTALKNLPLMLVLRCQWTMRRQDFEQAIELAKEGLELARVVHCQDDQLARYYWLQSIAFETKYQQTGDIEALSSAIDLARMAVVGVANIPGKHANYLHYLGVMLDLRYAATSNLGDIEEAIQHAEYGLSLGSTSGNFLKLLAGLHETKYHTGGDLHDLNKCLIFRKQAVETVNQEDGIGLIALPGLVTSLRSKYDGIGALEGLDESLKLLEDSLTDKVDRREKSKLLSSLGSMYEARYHLTASLPDLDRAISLFEEALSILPPTSPEIAKLHGELSFQLQLRYRALNQREDLETAIAWAAQALSETPILSSQRPSLLHYLSQSCSLLYLESEDPADLNFALVIGFEATEEFPEHHPEFASVMINLGEILSKGFCPEQHDHEWLYLALQFFMNAFRCSSASPPLRLNAAEQAANVHIALARLLHGQVDMEDSSLSIQKHWHSAYEIFAEAVGVLPVLSRLSVTMDAQKLRASQHLSLASRAASVAIKGGETAFEAVRLLETGRCIFLENMTERIHGLSDLERVYPELAREFDELCQRVEGLNESFNGDVRASLLMLIQHQQRIRDVKLLEDTLRKIRDIPEFENFLSLSEAELKLAAKDGPIVAINVTEASSDAILIQTSGVSCLHLPQLSSVWVKTQLGRIDKNILNSREPLPDKNRRMRSLLEMLWGAVVKPVLQALGFYTHEKISALPHVWWIGVGIMARAPFHAAGCYPKSPNSKTADYASKYCISSYTPTVRSLLHFRTRESEFFSSSGPKNPPDKILFITAPQIPGGEAREAVDSILASLPSKVTKTLLISPSSTLALERIREHNVVHFACHCISDFANSSKSRIILSNSPEAESLTIEEISASLTLQPVYPTSMHYLVYLSECICTEFMGTGLVEEGLHIGSGFQLAGFSHAVGTLWNGDSTVSKKISEEFFRNLFNREGLSRGSTGGDGAEFDEGDHAAAPNSIEGLCFSASRMTCAEALHRAIEKVKIGEGYWWNPLDWAQFCHWGI